MAKSNLRTMGNTIRQYRRHLKMSRLQLAVESNLSLKTVLTIENDKASKITFKSVINLTKGLKLNPIEALDLFGWGITKNEMKLDKPLPINRYEQL
ncbi:MAG: helix-turn-helix transcriptional regulator [bacterium]